MKRKITAASTLALSMLSASAFAAPVLEPTTQAFLDSLAGSTPIYKMTPANARKVLEGAQAKPDHLLNVDIEDKVLPIGPKGKTNIRVIRPQGFNQKLPVIVYFHGAGWVMGDKNTHDRLVRELAVGSKATLVFVDYSRSPENHYPVAIEEDYAVTKYIADHADEFNVDASRLAVAGDSVGGNMAAVVTLLAKERKTPAIKAQLLFYPGDLCKL
ncbi:acetyl esterase/lipase [Ewingella americana]